MKIVRFLSGRWGKICFALTFLLGVLLISEDAKSQVFIGSEANGIHGSTTASSPSVFSFISQTTNGGQGSYESSLDYFGSSVESVVFGNATGDANSPVLRSRSTPAGTDNVSVGYASAMAAYQYTGDTASLIEFDWQLTAALTRPTDTAAGINANAGLVTNTDMYSTTIDNFFESDSTVEDSMFYSDFMASAVNETGTMSFMADPGEVFHLVMGLQSYGGRNGADADASSTFLGTLTSSGGFLTAVPEPTSMSVLAMLGMTGMLRRRRRATNQGH